MTATPVNNSLDDLRALLEIADPALRSGPDHGLLERLRPPQKADPTPAHAVLEQRMVRRTVQFIERTYGDDHGFPRLTTTSITYRLTPRLRGVVRVLGHATLCVEADGSTSPTCAHPGRARLGSLQFAAYRGPEYLGLVAPDRLARIRPLLRKMLPKRLESSVAAALATSTTMLETNAAVRRALDADDVPSALRAARRGLAEVRDDDAPDDGDDPPAAGDRPDPAGVTTWRRHLASDAAVLRLVRDQLAAELAAGRDPKITAVCDAVAGIVDRDDGRHVVCLSTSAVTASAVTAALGRDPRVARYLRVLLVDDRTSGAGLRRLLGPLDPDGGADDERLCVVGTDRIGEGMNLQRAAHVVHIDLPWNPRLLPQRVGRIRRQRSSWPVVHAHAVLPDPVLDGELLDLVDILSRKLREAEASVGQSVPALPGDPPVPRDFAAMLKPYLGHAGPAPADTLLQRSDRYRALLGAVTRCEDLAAAVKEFPWAGGALHPGTGDHPRVLLCLADPRRAPQPGVGGATLAAVTLYGPEDDQVHVSTDMWLNLADFEVPVDEVAEVPTVAAHDLPGDVLGWVERAAAAVRRRYPDCGEVRAWLLRLPAQR